MPATLTWADWDVWTDWTDWFGPAGVDVPGVVDLRAVSTLTVAGTVRDMQAVCALTATSTLSIRAVAGIIIRPRSGNVPHGGPRHPRPNAGRITRAPT